MTTFVTRAQWGARPRKLGTTSIVPNPSVTFHYVGGGWEYPWDHSTCDDKVRGIQADHMDNRDWSDIAYNYLVCPHDYVYEGRGHDRRSSANGSESANNASFAICALWGTASADDALPIGLKRAFLWARSYLMSKGGATSVVKGHRDWKSTSCPGDQIYTWIKAGLPLPSPSPLPTFEDAKMLSPDAIDQVESVVQRYSNFNAENLRQRMDDIARLADTEQLDDFAVLGNMFKQQAIELQEVKGELETIRQLLTDLSNRQ